MRTNSEQRRFFAENGYLIIPDLFSRAEVTALLRDVARLQTPSRVAEASGRNKGGMVVEDGRTPRLQFQIHETDSLFAPMCRHPRFAGVMQELMQMPLYIYHSKLAFKAPFNGSVQYWHQDFDYWTQIHDRPDMGSCLLMLDEHTEDNACMQILSGSHQSGLCPHEEELRGSTGDAQRRIPAEDMFAYCRQFPRVKLLGKPGTFAAWHSLTLHASSHNISENDRRALIVAFNAVGNSDPARVSNSPFTAHSDEPVKLSAEDSLTIL